jgi:uncharacterized protein (DUF4415 family)
MSQKASELTDHKEHCMSTNDKIPGTTDAWEDGRLGEHVEHARATAPDNARAIDDALGLQMISIRLNKDLIDTFKRLAEYHGIGYQPLMRDALRRFAEAEMKQIVIANTNLALRSDAEVDVDAVHVEEPPRKCA